jgi:hypothetical protein
MLTLVKRASCAMMLVLPLLAASAEADLEPTCTIEKSGMAGLRDGNAGLGSRFAERSASCPAVEEGAEQRYLKGWMLGNERYWTALGVEDGRNALGPGHYATRLRAIEQGGNKIPLNRPAYEEGLREGTQAYWKQLRGQGAKPAGAAEAQPGTR